MRRMGEMAHEKVDAREVRGYGKVGEGGTEENKKTEARRDEGVAYTR